MNLKCVSQIFKILFQTGDIVFDVLSVFFSRYVRLRSSFPDEKKPSAVKSEIHFSREAIEN